MLKIHHTDHTITKYSQNTNAEPAIKLLKTIYFQNQYPSGNIIETFFVTYPSFP